MVCNHCSSASHETGYQNAPIIARYAKMQGTVEKAKRARIVPAPTGYVPRAIPAYIRRANHPIAHTTSAARAMK